jgi:hypothetical protein
MQAPGRAFLEIARHPGVEVADWRGVRKHLSSRTGMTRTIPTAV